MIIPPDNAQAELDETNATVAAESETKLTETRITELDGMDIADIAQLPDEERNAYKDHLTEVANHYDFGDPNMEYIVSPDDALVQGRQEAQSRLDGVNYADGTTPMPELPEPLGGPVMGDPAMGGYGGHSIEGVKIETTGGINPRDPLGIGVDMTAPPPAVEFDPKMLEIMICQDPGPINQVKLEGIELLVPPDMPPMGPGMNGLGYPEIVTREPEYIPMGDPDVTNSPTYGGYKPEIPSTFPVLYEDRTAGSVASAETPEGNMQTDINLSACYASACENIGMESLEVKAQQNFTTDAPNQGFNTEDPQQGFQITSPQQGIS